MEHDKVKRLYFLTLLQVGFALGFSLLLYHSEAWFILVLLVVFYGVSKVMNYNANNYLELKKAIDENHALIPLTYDAAKKKREALENIAAILKLCA